MYLVCNTTVCALKQPRDFCCVCVEAREVPALLVVKMWEELGLACCEKQSLWASGPLAGEEGKLDMMCGGGGPRRLVFPWFCLHWSLSLVEPHYIG